MAGNRNFLFGSDNLRIYGKGPDLEQEFLVQPGGNLNHVQISYRGIDGLTIAKDGSLEVGTAFGKLRETQPRLYQRIAGKQVVVEGHFKLTGGRSYAFAVGAHAAQYALLIDPTLLYSTFLGGSAGNSPFGANSEVATGIAVDSSGNVYVTGTTSSLDFPTTIGAVQTTTNAGAASAFVSKLNATGSGLIYSTYLGFSDSANAISVDSAGGKAYVTGVLGNATGAHFPTTANAYWPTNSTQHCASNDFFLTELNPSGQLVYSSCFNASATPNAIALDSTGRAFIAGSVSGFIPTSSNAFQPTYPGAAQSGFVMSIDTTASGSSSLVYGTYVGIPAAGSNPGSSVRAITVDSFRKVYLTGSTFDGFPVTTGAFQTIHGPCIPNGPSCGFFPNAFVAKLDPSVSGSQALIYATYLGGQGSTVGNAIAVDASGSAYVTGATQSDFPVTSGSFQSTPPVNVPPGGGSTVGFATKLNAGGSQLTYSTFLEGICSGNCFSGNVIGDGITLDLLGNAYVTGYTTSSFFPVTTDAFQSAYLKPVCHTDCSDAFLIKLNTSGSAPVYSSYLGGTDGDDVATSVAIDSTGDAYVTGHTSSATFPVTPGAFQPVVHGTGDAFIAKFALGGTFRVLQILPTSGGNSGSFTATIFGSGFQSGASVKLSGGGGSDIVATAVSIGPNALFLTATFNLQGTIPGIRDLVVMNADGTVLTLPQSFTILAGGVSNVTISKTSSLAVPGRFETFTIVVSNSGSVDSGSVNLVEFLQPWFTFVSSNPVPTGTTSAPAAWPVSAIGSGATYQAFIQWVLPNIPPGSSTSITYVVKLDGTYPVGGTVSGPACSLTNAQCIGAAIQCSSTVISCAGLVAPPAQAVCAIGVGIGCGSGYVLCAGNCGRTVRMTQASFDPNSLNGLVGYGNAQWVAGGPPLAYTVSFANESTATVPAQQVIVTDLLNTNLDMSTLVLTSLSVPGVQVPIPPTFLPAVGQNEVTTSVDLRPAQNLLVNIDAKLNPSTGLITWTFSSTDPGTGQPPIDPSVGFLPPGAGGSLSFTIKPKQGLATGTQVADQATVVFDFNPPMNTPVWVNTIDNTPPVSRVSALAATSTCPAFRASWSGSDVGSGVQGFTIYVSDSGAPYTAWLSNTTAASADFLGAAGHSYSFYSIATDLTGNMEGAKTSPEATTSVTASGPCGAPSLSGQVSNIVQSGATVTATLTLTNTGFTAAQAVNINQMTFRTLSGSGTVTLASPAIPAAEGPLAIGASTAVALTLNVPTTVTRFSLTESGTIKDAASNSYNYSIAQTVIP